jgi:hypothetical protein
VLLTVFLLIAVLTAGEAQAQALSGTLDGATQAVDEPSEGISAGAPDPQGTASEPAGQASEAGGAEPVATPGQETTADPVIGTAQETAGPVAAPTPEAPAPILSVGDQTAAPATAPVEETVEPVVAPVEQTLEPTVAPVLTSAYETVDPVLAPVQNTIEPVLSPVQQTVAPVVEPVTTPVLDTVTSTVAPIAETVDPVLAPVQKTIEPVTTPVLETAEPVLSPVEETIRPIREVVEPAVVPIPPQDASPPLAPVQEPAELVTTPARESTESLVPPELVDAPVRAAGETVPARKPDTSAFEGGTVREQELPALLPTTEAPASKPLVATGAVAVPEVATADRGLVSANSGTLRNPTGQVLAQILTSRHAEPTPVKVSGLGVAFGAALADSEVDTNVSGRTQQFPYSPSTALPPAGSLSGGSGSGGYTGVGVLVSLFVLFGAGKLLRARPEHLRPNSAFLPAIERPG